VPKVVERLHGMFAIGIWDAARRRLFSHATGRHQAAYFSWTRAGFCSPSEIKACSRTRVDADVEPRSVYHYLSFLTTPAPLTMFRGIFKMPQAAARS
jgi:asparagine synthase (glutamine-hydrolysing)